MSGKGGTLEAHGGVDFMWLGDNMKLLNDDDGFKPVVLDRFHVHLLIVVRCRSRERLRAGGHAAPGDVGCAW